MRRRGGAALDAELGPRIVADAVAVTRLTRELGRHRPGLERPRRDRPGADGGRALRGARDRGRGRGALPRGLLGDDADRPLGPDLARPRRRGRRGAGPARDLGAPLRPRASGCAARRGRGRSTARRRRRAPPREARGDRARQAVQGEAEDSSTPSRRWPSGGNGAGLAAGERDPNRAPGRAAGTTSFGEESGSLDDEEGEPGAASLRCGRAAARDRRPAGARGPGAAAAPAARRRRRPSPSPTPATAARSTSTAPSMPSPSAGRCGPRRCGARAPADRAARSSSPSTSPARCGASAC